MKLSEKIIALRKARGMSQENLAEQLGISRQAVSRWETDSALPDAANILQLSRLFGVTADYLLDDAYNGTQTSAAAPQPKKPPRLKIEQIAGICLAAFGLLGNFVLYIVSRFVAVPVPRITYDELGQKWYEWSSANTDYSFKYFIDEYNLDFLTGLFWAMLAAGLLMLFIRRESWKAFWRFLKKFR